MARIEFDKIENARDLGGIETGCGVVRGGKLLRTAMLSGASDKDRKKLESYHLGIVFDLRSRFEISRAGDISVKGADNINAELVNVNGQLFQDLYTSKRADGESMAEHIAAFLCRPAAAMLFDGFYEGFVDDAECRKSFAMLFRTVIDRGCPPILWHCTQGKDRTGLVAALMLFALGADRDTVMEDFLESNPPYEELVKSMCALTDARGGGEEARCYVRGMFGVMGKWFEGALDMIDWKWGSMDNYLTEAVGLSQDDRIILQNSYLDQL